MADVRPGDRRTGTGDRRTGTGDRRTGTGDRAQLLLVAGLVIAVMFVALALTLNTVIYTENLASRSSGTAGGDASIRFLDTTEEAIEGILDRANRNHNESHAAVRGNVTAGLATLRNTTGRTHAASGIVTNVSERTLRNGTRIVQTNGSRSFTAADGSADWTLADDVSGTRQFRINATNASLTNTTQAALEADEVFYVHVNAPSATWEVYVYKDLVGANTINVTVRNVTSGVKRDPCSTTGDHAFVNVTAGTVGGDPCPGLSFVSDLGSSYAITYNDTETFNGTYHLIVDDASVARSPGPALNDAPGDSPWADPAVYAVYYDVIYETARLQYETNVRVAPGEADD
jgi:hypothetical protein